ncbi:MAG: hypothetical protein JRH20_16395 [Deltaproteobacteria bacterium]|nr:hypothetical protein [Deltaproteobacteria bacterium]
MSQVGSVTATARRARDSHGVRHSHENGNPGVLTVVKREGIREEGAGVAMMREFLG